LRRNRMEPMNRPEAAMSKLEWIGLAVAACATGHLGIRALTRWCRRGRRFLDECVTGWMDGLEDLAPGRLAHGQPRDDAPGRLGGD
ncbi:MAG: hypothetical protein ACODAE_05370, partial [Gemmatimonadota bacterium]